MTESDKPEQPESTPPSAPHPEPPPQPYGAYPGSYPPPPPPQSSGGYPPPYGGGGGYSPPPTAPKNGMGIAALIIAIIGLLAVWSVLGGIILGIVAVIIGFVAYGRTKRGEATNGGVAIAGIVLGFVAIVISLIFIPIWISFVNDLGAGDYISCIQEAGGNENALQQCEENFREQVEDRFGVTLTP